MLRDAGRREVEPVRDAEYAGNAQRYMKSDMPYLGSRREATKNLTKLLA